MKSNETTTSDSTGNNTLLAVSGQPKFTIEEVIESIKTLWIKDFGRLDSNSPDRDGYFVCGFVHEALRAACDSGAVDTKPAREVCIKGGERLENGECAKCNLLWGKCCAELL